jgi:hypothetical protein
VTEKLLFSTTDELLIQQIISVLNDHHIAFIRKDEGSGSYLNLYMGQSFQKKFIYVSEQDYDLAISFLPDFVFKETVADSSSTSDSTNFLRDSKHLKRSLAFILLVFPTISIF